jgi:glycosyltransferase involved in cell wall biosynthesis
MPETGSPSEIDVSVVVACVEAARSIDRCLASIEAAGRGYRTEIIVVDASTDGTADRARAHRGVTVLEHPPDTLVPELWGAGFRVSRGPAVVFTIGHVIVPPEWLAALLEGLKHAEGVGGPLTLAPASGPVDWAVFYLRYSAFLPHQLPEGHLEGEIAGDNAAYRRRALEAEDDSLVDGFWEVEFHRRLRRAGGRLAGRGRAAVQFTYSAPLACIARHRFDHGRHFGAQRVAHGASALRVAAAAPLVPLVLALRAARRVLPARSYRTRFIASLPVFLALASAWAAGEAVGAVFGRQADERL